ncbi:hypothetical protein EWM64_g9931 [Hericium alpestre]|uniref:Uncharacterized protein n=1 Tax=Hericium alpestre TaxID=135208 RepID=A0A4Y9ZJQ4_9AGAM|nr:hypothetical protein EWM64_g9931 [Hericium alpestre]
MAPRNMESGSSHVVNAPNNLDNNVVMTTMAWYSDLHSPSYVAVSARWGKCLVLDDHKMAVRRIGLDGPVERYAETKH